MPSAPAPVVIALMGLPGAGKSTLAGALCREFGLHEVNRDRIRMAMFPACEFTRAEKRAANAAVQQAVLANAALGRSTLIDGMTFSRRAELHTLADALERCGGRLIPLLLQCPAATARARLARQQSPHPAGDRTAHLVDEVARRFEEPPTGTLRVDARQSARAVQVAAARLIARSLREHAGQPPR